MGNVFTKGGSSIAIGKLPGRKSYALYEKTDAGIVALAWFTSKEKAEIALKWLRAEQQLLDAALSIPQIPTELVLTTLRGCTRNGVIRIIKCIRDATNLSLREAKGVVDDLTRYGSAHLLVPKMRLDVLHDQLFVLGITMEE